ncbi:MAG: DNA repair protein RecN, partial [Proteobacteria bacterium]
KVSNQDGAAVTQIYDEVDVCIGGRVAGIVGQKLRAVAAALQVLCVTHLPQVASQAEHHKRVAKSGRETAAVHIETLDERERTAEIARMLGGIEITDRTLEHAGEMLNKARK